MKKEVIIQLHRQFEEIAQVWPESETEYRFARDLQMALGYKEWRNFSAVIAKAITACENSGYEVSDHFVDVNKMVDLGSGSQRRIQDIMLTRYACYLIAQNADPSKDQPSPRFHRGGWGEAGEKVSICGAYPF